MKKRKRGRPVGWRKPVVREVPLPPKESTQIINEWIEQFERSEKVKVIDHIRNIILPYLEQKL